MNLKLQKAEANGNFLSRNFFSRAIEISRQFCASSNSFFTEKKFNRCAGPYHMFEKLQKSYECPKQ